MVCANCVVQSDSEKCVVQGLEVQGAGVVVEIIVNVLRANFVAGNNIGQCLVRVVYIIGYNIIKEKNQDCMPVFNACTTICTSLSGI